MRTCKGCQQSLGEEHYYTVKQRGKVGLNSKCKACCALKDRLPVNRWSRNNALAKRSGLRWEIELPLYVELLNRGCVYCGEGLLTTTGIGLDRKDSYGHYTPDNVTPCCWTCNYVKRRTFTHEEMLEIGPIIRRMKDARIANGQPPLQPPNKYSAREGQVEHTLTRYRREGGFDELARTLK